MNLRPSVSGSCGRVYCTLVLRREGTMDGREEGLVVESAECAGLKLPVFSVSSAAPMLSSRTHFWLFSRFVFQ